ncbi:DUF3313 family protein [Cellvibrio sp. KY-GH-1]|uniref:DUF3313 family protein n=1 Tax=Cellvibrio sp. KY-GH-1 TaxID=2303332 RepID=UPI001247AD11|nr:DUF3313 family protein [Cellvibrio sp. KY-GH-1]QEY14513.1 DUF3313 family protein [Cellvibrio sp. KY-GH-1]
MKAILKHTALRLSLIALASVLVAGCSVTKKHEKDAQVKADKEGLSVVKDSKFDGTFVAPNAQFAQYKKLFVEQLDMTDVKIRKLSNTNFSNDTPWELNDNDRRYYQERYTEALMNNLIVDGRYSTAMQAGADVMTVRAKVLEIAPLGSKDDFKGRPNNVKVYSEGMGTMTLEISLYDSASGKVLGIITDQRDLGRIWEENNRVTNNVQVRVAFDAWLKKLRNELDRLSK